MPLDPLPAVPRVLPVTRNPDGTGPRPELPASRHPDVRAAVPAVESAHPDVTGGRRDGPDLDARGRRPDADVNAAAWPDTDARGCRRERGCQSEQEQSGW